ncbi:MAG TPA: Rrf2 family transcriptional regulator [Kiritimatiellia bacterium]|nr:Rrf2 family transcriptional regulator [Kiritimatiellia bacterium]
MPSRRTGHAHAGRPAGRKNADPARTGRDQSASEKYLWQVMNALTSAGLVRAARGAQGGYRLAHASRAITLKDIVFALDGPCKLVAHSRMNNSSRSEERVESEIWADMERKISTYLASSTLRDLRERCDRQNQMPDYVI